MFQTSTRLDGTEALAMIEDFSLISLVYENPL